MAGSVTVRRCTCESRPAKRLALRMARSAAAEARFPR
jgi:hypothetical protein